MCSIASTGLFRPFGRLATLVSMLVHVGRGAHVPARYFGLASPGFPQFDCAVRITPRPRGTDCAFERQPQCEKAYSCPVTIALVPASSLFVHIARESQSGARLNQAEDVLSQQANLGCNTPCSNPARRKCSVGNLLQELVLRTKTVTVAMSDYLLSSAIGVQKSYRSSILSCNS